MDVFALRDDLVDTYSAYTTSFLRPRDGRVRARVREELDSGRLWPHPRVGLNPSFEFGDSISDLVDGTAAVTCFSKSPLSTDLPADVAEKVTGWRKHNHSRVLNKSGRPSRGRPRKKHPRRPDLWLGTGAADLQPHERGAHPRL